jgi:hypothetical protein
MSNWPILLADVFSHLIATEARIFQKSYSPIHRIHKSATGLKLARHKTRAPCAQIGVGMKFFWEIGSGNVVIGKVVQRFKRVIRSLKNFSRLTGAQSAFDWRGLTLKPVLETNL